MPPNTMGETESVIEKEIRGIMKYCNICTQIIGMSFIDKPRNFLEKLRMDVRFILCCLALLALCSGEAVYMVGLLKNSESAVEEFVAGLHLMVYAYSGLAKLVTLRFKRKVFRRLLIELANIWPNNGDEEEESIKTSSIVALLRIQFLYLSWNSFGLACYFVKPLALTAYYKLQGVPTEPAFIWFVSYPFDKRDPVYHKIAYIFEMFAGFAAVGGMMSSELMFAAMASNTSMLLRILQCKTRKLIYSLQLDNRNRQSTSNPNVLYSKDTSYDQIVSLIKIHQKIIRFSNELEDAFSLVNLSNVLLSSIMICSVVFNVVLLDSWMEVSNKFFLGSLLFQIGFMCWYADDTYSSSLSVADAVYESAWYEATPRCRRALLLMILRSQKPICFTAYKFSYITMTTYSSILTTSYSYFALLYTMFRRSI